MVLSESSIGVVWDGLGVVVQVVLLATSWLFAIDAVITAFSQYCWQHLGLLPAVVTVIPLWLSVSGSDRVFLASI